MKVKVKVVGQGPDRWSMSWVRSGESGFDYDEHGWAGFDARNAIGRRSSNNPVTVPRWADDEGDS